MCATVNIFESSIYHLNDNAELHLIDIKKIEGGLKSYLDSQIVSICEGVSDSTTDEIKEYLVKFFTKKKDSEIEIGAISEFFVHLYMSFIGFKQDCLYLNLEELSIKKGFDGYYSKGIEEWILESKSGRISTEKISHNKKVKEAYNDLKNKLAGKSESKNDPWRNAFNHASLRHVGSAEDLVKNLKKFSKEFQKKNYHDIKDFNVVPSSTIFFDDKWVDFKHDEIVGNLKSWIAKLEFSKILAIGVSQQTKQLFLNYLNNN